MPGLTDHKPDIKPADKDERPKRQRTRTTEEVEEETDKQLEKRLKNERDATIERAEASFKTLRKLLNKRNQTVRRYR